jgi:2-polyprenyl-6-methoxyphenol hydroxylase-like FAD-dependent oxidoreductase
MPSNDSFVDLTAPEPAAAAGPQIRDGDTVAVVGGGPAGASFAIFFLGLAKRLNLEVDLVIFEHKDFGLGGARGCNQCAGVVSENLLASLAIEGIVLREPVVQRGINRYRFLARDGEVELVNKDEERAIATVYRAGGPSRSGADASLSFDRHMLDLARQRGAHVVGGAAESIEREGDGFRVAAKSETVHADLLVGAFGHRQSSVEMFEGLGFGYRRPAKAQTLQCEIALPAEEVTARFGGSILVTMPPLRGISFVGLTPKAQGLTLSILGDNLGAEAANRVLSLPQVARVFPGGKPPELRDCQCRPWITVGCAGQPFADRVVVIGDACVSRLYKDGIGSAFLTANAAATSALLFGVSARAFQASFMRAVRRMNTDNHFGRFLFAGARYASRIRMGERALVGALRCDLKGGRPSISQVVWDMLTGGRPYMDIFRRAVGARTMMMVARGLAGAVTGRGG